jgi:hypothetical protein
VDAKLVLVVNKSHHSLTKIGYLISYEHADILAQLPTREQDELLIAFMT